MPTKQEKRNEYANVAPATRHRMQAVRRYDTAPEIQVRRMLHAMGYRFRLHRRDLPGSPDIVLPRHRKIVLVHGCFWHGHAACKRAKLPINNLAIWHAKIENNRARDQKNVTALGDLGWDVMVIWECELGRPENVTNRLCEFIPND